MSNNVSRRSIIAGITAAVAGVIVAVSFKASAAGVIGRKVTFVDKSGARVSGIVEGFSSGRFVEIRVGDRSNDAVFSVPQVGNDLGATPGVVGMMSWGSNGKTRATPDFVQNASGWRKWRLAPEDHDIITATA